MITFSISLGMPTVMVLLSFDKWREAGYPRPPLGDDETYTPFGDLTLSRHFITSTNKLIREGYLTHSNPKGKMDSWQVTEKGIHLAAVIRIEFKDSGEVSKELSPKTKPRKLEEKKK